jgi:signal peptidase II
MAVSEGSDRPAAPALERGGLKARVFWSAFVAVLALDIVSKLLVVRHLEYGVPYHVVGDLVRFTLAYNRGAAFSMHVGAASRWFFSIVAVIVLLFLARLYRATPRNDATRALALGLVCAGAIGNLIDRLRSPLGVIDFIDIGIGEQLRWYTFNVADMGVSIGAVLLAWSLWREERKAGARG